MREVTLEKLKFALVNRLSKEMVDEGLAFSTDVTIEQYAGFLADEFIIQIKAEIFGESVKYFQIKYPLDWKESFKERWFPKWLLKHYPVKYSIHKIDTKVLYPDLNISVPDRQHEVRLFTEYFSN